MSQTKEKDNVFLRIVKHLIPWKGDKPGAIIRKSGILTAAAVLTVLLIKIPIDSAQRAHANEPVINDEISEPVESSSTVESTVSSTTTVPKSTVSSTSSSTVSTVETTSEEETEPQPLDLTPVVNTPLNVNFDYLKSLNPDVRAWIKITGTLLNSEVLQSTYDFDYYIDHDFYGNYNEYSPCIFSSDINRWDGSDDNLILFSHKLNSGYGFGSVVYYVPDWSSEPLYFYKKHPTILFQQPGGESETYKIFAGILANTDPQYGEVFEYISKIYFYGEEDFHNYMCELLDRSWFYTDVDLQYGDKFLTLSTCYWPNNNRNIPTRWVLFARKVRPGESEYVDTSVAWRNYDPKMYYGGQWGGRTWDTSKLLS